MSAYGRMREKFMEIQYHYELHELHFFTRCSGRLWFGHREEEEKIIIDECVVHMLPPAIKSANAMAFSFMIRSVVRTFLDRKSNSFALTHIGWAALAHRSFLSPHHILLLPFSLISLLIQLLLCTFRGKMPTIDGQCFIFGYLRT